MKKHFTPSLQRLIIVGIVFLVIFIPVIVITAHSDTQKRFDRLTHSLFREQLSQNTIDLHFTLAHPEAFGITDYEVTLPCYNRVNEQKQQLYLENLLGTLAGIDPIRLNKEDRWLLRLLQRNLAASLDISHYEYFSEPLSPSDGMHTQLPILLSEYTFRSTRDVEDYLSLLEQMDVYFTSLLEYETEKKNAGLFMAASSVDKVISQCDTIVTNEELMKGSHFLQTSFARRLKELSQNQPLTEKQIETYCSRNDHILKNIILPAYQALADGLFLLRDENISLKGLAGNPHGADYYQRLLITRVGSYTPPEEIKKMYIRQMNKDYQAITCILSQNPQAADALMRNQYQHLPISNPEQMLDDLRMRMEPAFPSYLLAGHREPTVVLKDLDENLREFCAPAFYFTVPIDDCNTNVIYINNVTSLEDLELYTTLAHESFPGHLYQTVFRNRFLLETNANPMHQLLWYGGYLEGWALYVEFIAYDFASDMLEQEHRLADALCVEMEKHNRSMQLCLYSLLDYIIHYENASVGDLVPYLEAFGVTDMETIRSIYEYIVETPCNYPQYYLGYLEICQLKESAQIKWGDRYSDYRFHSFLLEQGPADFTSLEERLTQ